MHESRQDPEEGSKNLQNKGKYSVDLIDAGLSLHLLQTLQLLSSALPLLAPSSFIALSLCSRSLLLFFPISDHLI